MPDLLIRNLKPETVDFIKSLAARHGRSVQAEITALLEEARAEEVRRNEFWTLAAELRRATANRPQTDSADLIREDRDTDHGRDL